MNDTDPRTPPKLASIKDTADYLKIPGESLGAFGAAWKALSDEAKTQIRTGIGNGTCTY